MVLGGAARVVAVADDAGRGVVAGDGEDTLRRGDGDVGGAAAFEGGLADPGAGDLHGFGRVEAVRGAEREAAGGGEVFADAELARGEAVGVGHRDGDEVVGAGERNGERGGADVAVGVGDGVGEDVGGGLAGVERLHRRVGVVERVGVAAVGSQHQRAVGAIDVRAVGAGGAGRDVAARYAGAGHDAGDGGSVGTQGVSARARGDDVARDRVRGRVFGHGVDVGVRYGDRINDVDRERTVGAVAAEVVDRECDGIGGCRGAGLVHRAVKRVGVCEGAGGRIEAGQREGAGAGVDGVCREVGGVPELRRSERGAADDDAGEPVRCADGDRAGGRFAGVAAAGEALFVDRGLARCAAVAVNRNDARHAVGIAVDGDDERRRAGVAIRIGDRVGVGLAQRLAGLQGIHRRVGVVERVGVAAVGIELEAAVAEGDRAGGRRDRVGDDIGADVVVGGEDIAVEGIRGSILADGVGVVLCLRNRVDDVDAERGAGRAARARYRHGDVVDRFADTRLADRTLERIAVAEHASRRVVAGNGEQTLSGVDRICREIGGIAELRCGEGGAADREADHAAGNLHGDRAGRRFAGVAAAEQATFADGRLARRHVVAVIRRDGRGSRPRAGAAANRRLVELIAVGTAEPEDQRIDILGNAQQADEGTASVDAARLAGGRFLKQFVERTALVDRLDDALELAIAGEQRRIGGIGLHFAGHFRIDRQLFAAAHEPRRSILQRQLDPTPGPRRDDVAFAYGVADFQAADDALRAAGKDFSLKGGYAGNDEGFGHDVRSDRISGWRNNSRPLPGCLLY